MGHNIFGERFYNRSDELAWHKLGIHDGNGTWTAVEALRALPAGVPDITLQPLYAVMPDTFAKATKTTEAAVNPTRTMKLPERAIVRWPTDDDPEWVPFGVVGPEYHLMTPLMAAQTWDAHVVDEKGLAVPVETTGLLQRGKLYFLSTKLPMIDVAGDEVEMYLVGAFTMDGILANRLDITPVRPVCNNTLTIGQGRATRTLRVVHTEAAVEELGAWMASAYLEARTDVEVIREAFEILAGTQPTPKQVDKVLTAAYPLPQQPERNAPTDVMKVRMERFERYVKGTQRRHEAVLSLWGGEGRGQDTRAAKGTLWGLWNAVVETEDYRRGSNRGGNESERVAESALFGPRREVKARAYDACMEVIASGV